MSTKPGQLQTAALPLQEIALDGIPTGSMDAFDQATLYPGYRVDALVKFSDVTEGDKFLLVDASESCMKSGSDGGADWHSARYVLAQIEIVSGSPAATQLPTKEQLIQARADYAYKDGPIEPLTEADLDGPNNDVHFAAYSLIRGTKLLPYWCPTDGGHCKPCLPSGKTADGEQCGSNEAYNNSTQKTDYWYIDSDGNKVSTGLYMVCDRDAPDSGTDTSTATDLL